MGVYCRVLGRSETLAARRRRGQRGLILGFRGSDIGIYSVIRPRWTVVHVLVDGVVVVERVRTSSRPLWFPLEAGFHVVEVVPFETDEGPFSCRFEVRDDPVVVAFWPEMRVMARVRAPKIVLRGELE